MQALLDPKWPEAFPFRPDMFGRYDESLDTQFYNAPRFVTHIDDNAIKALTQYYEAQFPKENTDQVAILDMCSSWISHYPKDFKAGRVVGTLCSCGSNLVYPTQRNKWNRLQHLLDTLNLKSAS